MATSSARFTFVHPKKKRFAWVEVQGLSVHVTEGAVGSEGEASPTIETCASAPAAAKKRDHHVADLMARGFTLVVDVAAAPAKKKRVAAKGFVRDAALESALREDPWSEARWEALEAHLVSHDDPRAAMLRFEREGARGDAAIERGRLRKLLYGDASAGFDRAITQPDWAAGYLRDGWVVLEGRRHIAYIEALVAAPAALFLRSLGLQIQGPELPYALDRLIEAPFAPWLRALSIQFTTQHDAELEGAALDPFARLERLTLIDVPRLSGARTLDRLLYFRHMPGRPGEIGALFAAGGFPRLEELVLDVRAHATDLVAELADVLTGRAAPRLASLTVWWADDVAKRALLDALATSALLPRLHTLSLGGPVTDPRELRPRYGDTFAHLASLSVPADVVS